MAIESATIFSSDKPPGTDNLDGKLLRMVADSMATPICHIFNMSLEEGGCPQAGRDAKVVRYPRVVKQPILVLTADLLACYQLLANCWKKLCLTKYNTIYL